MGNAEYMGNSEKNVAKKTKKVKKVVRRRKRKPTLKKKTKTKKQFIEKDGNKENEKSSSNQSEAVTVGESTVDEADANFENEDVVAEAPSEDTNIEIEANVDLKTTLKLLKKLDGNLMSPEPSDATQMQTEAEASIMSPRKRRKKAVEIPREISVTSILKDLETLDKYQFKKFPEDFAPMAKHRAQIYDLEQQLKEKNPNGFISDIESKFLNGDENSAATMNAEKTENDYQTLPNKE